ncbi:TetR/AcrR family transcriptional regulator [Gemella sanguinis]|jgi:transcriptional regulator, tetR family|uniref:TetR/AcrR family transcriptional regulator n=1 Tax=Gemella sanguinis TaxID=84135 RepID=UPI0028E5008E|nr:TetR/AcrR family transcriptional regulator [Gemella sanguinis]
MKNLITEFNNKIKVTNLSKKQQMVLIASLELFSELGFENTKTNDIAKRANVSEGTVYSFFKTKEGILNAIVSKFMDEIIPNIIFEFSDKNFINNYSSFSEFIYTIVKDRLIFIQENLLQLKIIFQRILIDKDLVKKIEKIVVDGILQSISSILNYYKKNNIIIDLPNERIVRYLFSLTLSYMIPQMIIEENRELDINEVTDEIVEFLTRALLIQ